MVLVFAEGPVLDVVVVIGGRGVARLVRLALAGDGQGDGHGHGDVGGGQGGQLGVSIGCSIVAGLGSDGVAVVVVVVVGPRSGARDGVGDLADLEHGRRNGNVEQRDGGLIGVASVVDCVNCVVVTGGGASIGVIVVVIAALTAGSSCSGSGV